MTNDAPATKDKSHTKAKGSQDRHDEHEKKHGEGEPKDNTNNALTGNTSDPSARLRSDADLARRQGKPRTSGGADDHLAPLSITEGAPGTPAPAEQPPKPPAEQPRQLNDQTVKQYAKELHEAVNRSWFLGMGSDADEDKIFQLLRSLGQADRKAIEDAYTQVDDNDDHRSLRTELQDKLNGTDFRKAEAMLNTSDGRTNDAGNLMVALSAIDDDRADGERRVIETFATLNSDTMKQLNEDFQKHYGISVEQALQQHGVSAEAIRAVEFVRKPIDQRTSEDMQNFARFAVEQKNLDYLSVALRGETPAAQDARRQLQGNPEFVRQLTDAFRPQEEGGVIGFLKKMGDYALGPIDEIVSGLINGDLTAGKVLGGLPIVEQFGDLISAIDAKEENLNLLTALDYLREGRVSLGTIAVNNTGSLFGWLDNKENIKLAVESATDSERQAFAMGRDVASSGRQPANDAERNAVEFYNRVHKAFSDSGDPRERTMWEAKLLYGKEGLLGKLSEAEEVKDRFSALENLSKSDWEALKDPTKGTALRREIEMQLIPFTGDGERQRLMQILDQKVAKDSYEDSKTVHRTLSEVIEQNKGSVFLGLGTKYDGKNIANAIADMNSDEAKQYRDDAAYRASLDKFVNEQLGENEKRYIQQLLRNVADTGEPPKIGPVEKILQNSMNGVEPKVAISDIETLLQQDATLRQRLSGDPQQMSEPDRALRRAIDETMSRAIFSSPGYQSTMYGGEGSGYAAAEAYSNAHDKVYKELWETGRLPADLKAELNLKTRSFFEQAASASPEERARLLNGFNVDAREKQLIETVAAQGGKMALEDKLRSFIIGDGSNYSDFKEELKNLSFEDRQKLKETYVSKYGKALEDEFLSKVDPKDRAVYKNALTPAEVDGRQDFYDNLEEALRSKSGLAPDGTELTLDRAVNEQAALFQEYSERFEKLPPEVQEKANQLFKEAIEDYRTSKEQFAEKIYQVAVLVGGLSVAIATGGVAVPALLAVATVSAAARVALMRGVRGEDYELSLGNILKDGAIGAATGGFSVLGPETLIAIRGAGTAAASTFAVSGAVLRHGLKEGGESVVASELNNVLGHALLSRRPVTMEALEQIAAKVAKEGTDPQALVPALREALEQGGTQVTDDVARTTFGSFTRETAMWGAFGGGSNLALESSVGLANGHLDVANLPTAFAFGAAAGGGLSVVMRGLGLAKPLITTLRHTPEGSLNITSPEEATIIARTADGAMHEIRIGPNGADLPSDVQSIGVREGNITSAEVRTLDAHGEPVSGESHQVARWETGSSEPNADIDRVMPGGPVRPGEGPSSSGDGTSPRTTDSSAADGPNARSADDASGTGARSETDGRQPRVNERGQRVDERGRLVNEEGELVNIRGERIDEAGWRVNEEGKRLDSKGNPIETEFPRYSEADLNHGRRAVESELSNWQTVTGENVYGLYQKMVRELKLSQAEDKFLRDGLAEIREHAARLQHIDPEQQVNWDHTLREFGAALQYARARGMSKDETFDLLSAAMWSDGLKTKFNFTTHNIDGALAFENFAARRGLDPERIARIQQAIREHQIAPPEFMATIYGNIIKFSKPPLTEAEQEVLKSLTAKMANPRAQELIDVPGGPSGAKALALTDEERALLQRSGLDEWYVPHEGNSWNRISQTLIDADGTDNYLGVGGASKIVKLRGPGKAAYFADRHARFVNPENPSEISSIESWLQSRRDFMGNEGKLGAASDEARQFIQQTQGTVEQQIDAAADRVNSWINSPEGRTELGLPAEGDVGKIPGWTGTAEHPDLLDYKTATQAELDRARKIWDKFGDELTVGQRTNQRPRGEIAPAMGDALPGARPAMEARYNSRGHQVDEQGWRINEHGQRLDSKGNVLEVEFPPYSDFELSRVRQQVDADMQRWETVSGHNVADEYANLRQRLDFSAEEDELIMNGMAEIREHAARIQHLDPEQRVNWDHTVREFGAAMEYAKARGLDKQETMDLLLAAMWSDGLKTKFNFTTHNVDGALAFEQFARRNGMDAERIAHIQQAIREHQIAPPEFMATIYGTTIRFSQPPLTEAEQAALKTLQEKIANPRAQELIDVPGGPPGAKALRLTEQEKALLQRTGLDEWYVPHEGNSWNRISQTLIDADGTDNYLGAGGASKIIKLRGPGKAAYFADRHARFVNPDNPAEISSLESWMQSRRDFVGNPGKMGAASDDARRFIQESEGAVRQQIDDAATRVNAWINSAEGRADLGLPPEGDIGTIPGWTGTAEHPDLLDYTTATQPELDRARKIWDKFGDELAVAQRTNKTPLTEIQPLTTGPTGVLVPKAFDKYKTSAFSTVQDSPMAPYKVKEGGLGQANANPEIPTVHAQELTSDVLGVGKKGDMLVRDDAGDMYVVPRDEFFNAFEHAGPNSALIPQEWNAYFDDLIQYPSASNPVLDYSPIDAQSRLPEIQALRRPNGDYQVVTRDGSFRIPQKEFEQLYKRDFAPALDRPHPVKVDTPAPAANDKIVPKGNIADGTEVMVVQRQDGTIALVDKARTPLNAGDSSIAAGKMTNTADGGYQIQVSDSTTVGFDAHHRMTDVIDTTTGTHTQITYKIDPGAQTTIPAEVYRYELDTATGVHRLNMDRSFFRRDDGTWYRGMWSDSRLAQNLRVNADGSITVSGKPPGRTGTGDEIGSARGYWEENGFLSESTFHADGSRTNHYTDSSMMRYSADGHITETKTGHGVHNKFVRDGAGTVQEATINGTKYVRQADGTYVVDGTNPPKVFATDIQVNDAYGTLIVKPTEDFRWPGRNKVVSEFSEYTDGSSQVKYRDDVPADNIPTAGTRSRPSVQDEISARVQQKDLAQQSDGSFVHTDTTSGARVSLDGNGNPTNIVRADGAELRVVRTADGALQEIHTVRDGQVESTLRLNEKGSWVETRGNRSVEFKQVTVNRDGSITKLDDTFQGVREYPDGRLTVVNSLGQERLPPEALDLQRARVIEAQKSLPSPAHQERFQRFMREFEERGARLEPPLSAEEVANTYFQVERILAAHGSAFSQSERLLLAQQMMLKAAEPRSISQGYFNTCNVTAEIEHRFFTLYPSQASRVVADIVESGRFIASDGTIIDMSHMRNTLHPFREAGATSGKAFDANSSTDLTIDGVRDLFDQVFQSTVVNTYWQRQSFVPNTGRTARRATTISQERAGVQYQPGDLRYELGADSSTGEFISNFSTNPPTRMNSFKETRMSDPITGREQRVTELEPSSSPEFGSPQMTDAGQQILGRTEPDHYLGRRSSGLGRPVETTEEMIERLQEMKQNGVLPATAFVDARHPLINGSNSVGGFDSGTGRHVINVQNFFERDGVWYVEFTNQWGSARNRVGTRAVRADEFFDALNHRPVGRNNPFPPPGPGPVPGTSIFSRTDWVGYTAWFATGFVGSAGLLAGGLKLTTGKYDGGYMERIFQDQREQQERNQQRRDVNQQPSAPYQPKVVPYPPRSTGGFDDGSIDPAERILREQQQRSGDWFRR